MARKTFAEGGDGWDGIRDDAFVVVNKSRFLGEEQVTVRMDSSNGPIDVNVPSQKELYPTLIDDSVDVIEFWAITGLVVVSAWLTPAPKKCCGRCGK